MAPDRSAAPDRPGAAAAAGGADLARQALAAARAQSAARRRAGQPVRGGGARKLTRSRWSGAGPDSRDPQPLAGALQKALTATGSASDITKATLFARWPELVGPTVAEHCTPTQFVDRVLSLQCSSTAWAAQIRLLAPQLVRTVNQQLGSGTLARIQAAGPSGPSWRFGPRHIAGRGPRDTYG